MKPAMISREEMTRRVVAPILASMEAGRLPWLRPWTIGCEAGLPFNPYRDTRDGKSAAFDGGLNNILLMIAAMANGWSDPRWTGRAQARKAGLDITGVTDDKGILIYAPIFGFRDGFDTDGKPTTIRWVKGFREVAVFNAQVFPAFPEMPKDEDSTLEVVKGYERAHAFYDALGVETQHGGNAALYSPTLDMIKMPPEGRFKSADAYHAIRLHEVGHSTGHKSRMNRPGITSVEGFGSPEYAYEELIAELFSAFACADVGIEKTDLTENHAAYLKSWIRRLTDDPEAFIKAAGEAWKALEYVRGLT